MTIEEIEKRIQDIKDMAGDDEAAHTEEDELHQDVLKYLAEQGNELAKKALETLDIEFSRWCA